MSPTALILIQGLPLAIVFLILYFAFIRPQRKKLKAHKKMIENVRPGDQVITEGGVYAEVSELLDDATIMLELAPNLRMKIRKQAISEVISKSHIDGPDSVPRNSG